VDLSINKSLSEAERTEAKRKMRQMSRERNARERAGQSTWQPESRAEKYKQKWQGAEEGPIVKAYLEEENAE
jgi:hypothetical protein